MQIILRALNLFPFQSVWRYYELLPQRSYSSTSVYPTDSFPDSQTVTCWKCGRQIQTVKEKKVSFFCPCDEGVILPPSVKNYFTILEWWATILLQYDYVNGQRFLVSITNFDHVSSNNSDPLGVDVGALKRKHTELQRSLHPDKFSIKSKVLECRVI